MLEIERDGMVGHLAEISPWLDPSTSAWANAEGKGSRGWEELPYWLKGYGDLGYVLGDTTIQRKARFWIEAMLSSQREDGWFGPRDLLTSLEGKPDLWPHMVMLNVLQSFYEYTADPRVIPFMEKYFAWENTLPESAFGAGYWPKTEDGRQHRERGLAVQPNGACVAARPCGQDAPKHVALGLDGRQLAQCEHRAGLPWAGDVLSGGT